MENIQSLNEKISALEKRITSLEIIIKSEKMDDKTPLVKKISVKEFIINKKPSGDVQKTLAITYYIEINEKTQSFNVEDLTHYFQLAKEPIPQNLNDKINMSIRKGHVMEAKEKKENKKAWVITNTGEQFVENNFKEIK